MSYETVHLVVEAKQRGEEAYNVRQNRSGIRIFVVGWMGRWIENHIYIFYLFLFFSFLFLILLNDLHTSSGWVLCRFKNDLVFIFFSYFIFGSLILKPKNSFFCLWLCPTHPLTHLQSLGPQLFTLTFLALIWRCKVSIGIAALIS